MTRQTEREREKERERERERERVGKGVFRWRWLLSKDLARRGNKKNLNPSTWYMELGPRWRLYDEPNKNSRERMREREKRNRDRDPQHGIGARLKLFLCVVWIRRV
jgi:hypothetical protein